jgi:hypothetical protein
MCKNPILNMSSIFSLLYKYVSLEIRFQKKMVRINSGLYIQIILFWLRIVWEIL